MMGQWDLKAASLASEGTKWPGRITEPSGRRIYLPRGPHEGPDTFAARAMAPILGLNDADYVLEQVEESAQDEPAD